MGPHTYLSLSKQSHLPRAMVYLPRIQALRKPWFFDGVGALTGAVEPLKGKAFAMEGKWSQKEIMIVPEKQTCLPGWLCIFVTQCLPTAFYCVPVVEGSAHQSCSEVMSSLR